MAKINIDAVRFAVATARGYPARVLKEAAQSRAEEVFEDAVIGMQIDFEEHPITREIAGGINSPNISQTLKGSSAPQSLFAFIGFPQGSDPLEGVRDALTPDTGMGKVAGPKFRYVGKSTAVKNARFTFEVRPPDVKAIYKATPMPWASGWSWVQKVETRIPGFANFLSKFMPRASDEVSRSKGGTQLKAEIRPGATYRPPANGYLSTIINNFLARVKDYSKRGLRPRFK